MDWKSLKEGNTRRGERRWNCLDNEECWNVSSFAQVGLCVILSTNKTPKEILIRWDKDKNLSWETFRSERFLRPRTKKQLDETDVPEDIQKINLRLFVSNEASPCIGLSSPFSRVLLRLFDRPHQIKITHTSSHIPSFQGESLEWNLLFRSRRKEIFLRSDMLRWGWFENDVNCN